jgi:hypothetical protein
MGSWVELEPDQQLATLRDWLRYAVSRFRAAGLSYGHGTGNAVDEAAYLILHTLHLPIDELEPWLDANLLLSERQAIANVIETRIRTRKPASYLTNEAWIQGHSFYVDERVIVPRSYLGELLVGRLAEVVDDPGAIGRALDLCTGSGCLAILAALAFPNASVDASDVSAAALEVARRNVHEYGLEERIRLQQSDLFGARHRRLPARARGRAAARACRRCRWPHLRARNFGGGRRTSFTRRRFAGRGRQRPRPAGAAIAAARIPLARHQRQRGGGLCAEAEGSRGIAAPLKCVASRAAKDALRRRCCAPSARESRL